MNYLPEKLRQIRCFLQTFCDSPGIDVSSAMAKPTILRGGFSRGRLLPFPSKQSHPNQAPDGEITVAVTCAQGKLRAVVEQSKTDEPPESAQDRGGHEDEDVFPRLCHPGMFTSLASLHKSLERAEFELNRLQQLNLLRPLSMLAYKWQLREMRQTADQEILEQLNDREKEALVSFVDLFGRVQTAVTQEDLKAALQRETERQKTRVYVHWRETASGKAGPQAPA